MKNSELRSLSRRDLIELLIRQEEQKKILQKRVTELEGQLKNRSIAVEKAGTLSEASLVLNGVFEKADRAAAQYLENIRFRCEHQDAIYNRIIADAEKKAKAIIENAEEAGRKKLEMSDNYWDQLNEKLDSFYDNYFKAKESPAHARKETKKK